LALRFRYQIPLGVSAEGACSLAVRVPRQRMVHGRVLPVVSGVAARVRGFGCLRWYTKKLVRGKKTVAQKIQTVFVDDLDGTEAEGTVRFGLDGSEYEIDLNAGHAQALREALAPYVSAARRAGGGAARRPGRTTRRAPATGLNTTEVREWAKSQGIDVKDRGRVPAELVVKFKAATGK
jgi:hypothetical protein